MPSAKFFFIALASFFYCLRQEISQIKFKFFKFISALFAGEAPAYQICALRSQFSVLRFPFSVLRSPFSVLRSPFSVLSSPFSVLRSPFSVFPFSVFRFPLSAFRFPFSAFRFPLSVFRSPFSVLRSPFSMRYPEHQLFQQLAVADGAVVADTLASQVGVVEVAYAAGQLA